jgi:hypothetical protein
MKVYGGASEGYFISVNILKTSKICAEIYLFINLIFLKNSLRWEGASEYIIKIGFRGERL